MKKKMADEKLTAKKVLLIVVLTAIAVPPACVLYYLILFFTYGSIGPYSPILGVAIVGGVPLLLAIAYNLEKRRTEK
jgi:hypothetical protein